MPRNLPSHSRSIGIGVLKLLTQKPYSSFDDLVRDLMDSKWDHSPLRYVDETERERDTGQLRRSTAKVLDDLRDMKLIKVSHDGFSFGGGPGDPPPEQGGFDGDDNSPGIRQIVAHPFLFVYGEKELAEAIAQAVKRHPDNE